MKWGGCLREQKAGVDDVVIKMLNGGSKGVIELLTRLHNNSS